MLQCGHRACRLVLTDAWMLQVLSERLCHVMLLAIDVAVEFWLSLQFTPQAQMMRESAQHFSLSDEARPAAAWLSWHHP